MAPRRKHRNRDSPVGVFEVANPATLWQSCPVPVRSFTITDAPPTAGAAVTPIAFASTIVAAYQRAGRDPGAAAAAGDELAPQDDDERFIVGLVLTYYRRHPQRARTRLLDLLGEVLTPPAAAAAAKAGVTQPAARPPTSRPGVAAPSTEDAHTLWLRTQTGVAPLKRGR